MSRMLDVSSLRLACEKAEMEFKRRKSKKKPSFVIRTVATAKIGSVVRLAPGLVGKVIPPNKSGMFGYRLDCGDVRRFIKDCEAANAFREAEKGVQR